MNYRELGSRTNYRLVWDKMKDYESDSPDYFLRNFYTSWYESYRWGGLSTSQVRHRTIKGLNWMFKDKDICPDHPKESKVRQFIRWMRMNGYRDICIL